MRAEAVPSWLVAWQAQQSQQVARPEPVMLTTPVKVPRQKLALLGFAEPTPWAYDGGVRREAVVDLDHNPPRVVRKVGWHRCLRCRQPFFSEDVVRQRLCGGTSGCREDDERFV